MAVKVWRSRSRSGGPDGTTQLMADGSIQDVLPVFSARTDTLPCGECGSQETKVNAADEWFCTDCGHDWQEV